MARPRMRLADTEVVAELYEVAPGTVRSWASRERWTKHGTRRNRLWDLDEIEIKHTDKEGTDTCPANHPTPPAASPTTPRPPSTR